MLPSTIMTSAFSSGMWSNMYSQIIFASVRSSSIINLLIGGVVIVFVRTCLLTGAVHLLSILHQQSLTQNPTKGLAAWSHFKWVPLHQASPWQCLSHSEFWWAVQ